MFFFFAANIPRIFFQSFCKPDFSNFFLLGFSVSLYLKFIKVKQNMRIKSSALLEATKYWNRKLLKKLLLKLLFLCLFSLFPPARLSFVRLILSTSTFGLFSALVRNLISKIFVHFCCIVFIYFLLLLFFFLSWIFTKLSFFPFQKLKRPQIGLAIVHLRFILSTSFGSR